MKSRCIKTICVVLFLTASACFTGCTDSSASKEQKQAHKAVQQALQEFSRSGDIQKAQSILRSAPTEGSGPAIDLIKANISLSQASDSIQQLPAIEKTTCESMTEIKNLTSRINTLILKKDQTADAVQQRKTMLDMSQNGSDDAPGLKGLENLRSEKEVSKQEIEKKIATLNEQAELAKKDAENIQSLANESFEKARMTTEPTQQAALEQKANEILAGNASSPGKSHYMSQYQTALDQIAALNSSLEIINLELENTSLEIAKTTKKIQDYKAADAQMDLQQSIVSMTSQIAQLSGAMSSNLAGIEETIAEYKKISEEAVKSIDTAINTFKKIPRDNADIQQMAKMLQAGALSTRAALLAGNAVFYATLSGNLSSIALPADKSISSPLLTSSDDYKATAVKSSQDAFDGFDLADKEYEGLRFNPNCPIIKSRVLNLFGKAKLAVVFDKTDIYASAVESAKTIVGDATDCTEEFKDSYITKTLDSMKK